MERIFINNYNFNDSWIMGKISSDIQNVAQALGYKCRIGSFEDYDGEEIVYHMAYHVAVPIKKAIHNSVFYTHLNDKLQEVNLTNIKNDFDSYICMSPEDAEFMIELGFDPKKVYGRTLPIRNSYIRPISIGIFSACYSDGRKNEAWLLDYCRTHENARLVNFVFVGQGWGNVCTELEKLKCTYEWHNVSRSLPYEYQFQQNKLANLNCYIYMGMDGGAMGSYDAYAQDVPLCVTFDGFHKSIPDLDYTFDDKKSFIEQLDKVVSKHARRLDFFKTHTAENYVNWLLNVWKGQLPETISESDKKCIGYDNVLEKKRDQYYPMNLGRVRVHITKQIRKYFFRKKAN